MRAKNTLDPRSGLATIELLLAMPILTLAFATLMMLAHASYKKNEDYAHAYITLMNRHTLSPPQFDDPQTAKLEKEQTVDRSKSSSNLVARSFPPTESWTVEASQSPSFLPSAFAEVYSRKTAIRGTIYKGTGSPEHRAAFPELDFVLPASDQVEALGVSAAVRAVAEAVDVNLQKVLDDLEAFKDLLAAVESIKALAEVDVDVIVNQAKEAGKEAAKQLVEFVKEEAKELAKSTFSRDWDKIRRLRKQIQLTRDSLEQLALARKQLIEILDSDEEFLASEEQ